MLRRPAVVALALALAACSNGGGEGKPTPPQSPSPSVTSSPSATPSPSPSPSPSGTATATRSPSPTPTPSRTTAPPVSIDSIRISLRTVASGLDDPVFVTHAGDATLYVVEQPGRILRLEPGGTPQPYLDIRGRVGAGGERGLLGLAFHPGFASNGRLFVNYTNTNGDTRVSEFRGTAASADAGSERVLLAIDQPYANHNGGMIAFGRDGNLYVGTGDGGSGGDPQNNGQSLDTLLGKVLRIDVGGGNPYRIPSGNPFVGRAGDDEIWAYGLRNPWRFSFDRSNGDLWLADVGQNRYEEVNLRGAGLAGGANFGWRVMEGRSCYDASSCNTSGKVRPVAVYGRGDGDCSVTGGYVYRGSASPSLRGVYLFGDYCSGFIRILSAADARDGDARHRIASRTGRPISSFGEGADGEVYVVFYDGAIARVTAA